MGANTRNTYLEHVVQEKAQLEEDLKSKRRSAPIPQAQRLRIGQVDATRAADVRITGFWRWKNVIVPPNAYVVHTRRGRAEPLHIGLGESFRFDPVTDAFLVVPAAMQTIIIQANCICRERQGVLVQAYVQWIIDDFETAYRNLDLSDPDEPMRVVNVQLREQAEAAIKDKVTTMSIDDVLADKQPIIEELTARLRAVAEGSGSQSGLGLRIVTVQIKEAVVCSPSVWEMLQRPFRSEREREARLAELDNQAVVQLREAESTKAATRLRIETNSERARLEQVAEAEEADRVRDEAVRRAELEALALDERIAHERKKLGLEHELARLQLEGQLATDEARAASRHRIEAEAVSVLAARRRVENDRSNEAIHMAMVEAVPAAISALPRLERLEAVTVGESALGALASGLDGLLGSKRLPEPREQ